MSEYTNIDISLSSKTLGSLYTISVPELSEWTCHLFGSDGLTGISWTPPKGDEPNWFWRKMQHLCFGNKWVKTK